MDYIMMEFPFLEMFDGLINDKISKKGNVDGLHNPSNISKKSNFCRLINGEFSKKGNFDGLYNDGISKKGNF